MKKILLLLVGFLLSITAFSQSKSINYQAVIMDPTEIDIPGKTIVGQPLSKGNVCLKFSIISADGSLDYEEIQNTQTDEFGLVNLNIGGSAVANSATKITLLGTGTYGSFNAIKWDEKRKRLKVSVSYDNCSSFTSVSSELLNYTPYALYAASVDYKNVMDAPTNLSQFNNDKGYIDSKALDPLKEEISKSNVSISALSDVTNSKFLVVNQQINVLDSLTAITKKKLSSIDNTLIDHNSRINSNTTSISQTNTTLSNQVGGLQQQITATNSTINQLGETYEVVSNKSNAANLGASTPSSELYPTQYAVKSYVDVTVQDAIASGAPDATTLAKGKVKLAGDLAGTADMPTVPGLTTKENLSNKSTSVSTDGASDSKYPSVKSVKDYVDASVSGLAFQANLDAKADKNSPTFTGTPNLPTGTVGVTQANNDNSTKLATTAFVQSALSAGVVDADASTKGKIQLTGDLSGTATNPTVPALANKENLSNKSTNVNTDGNSDTKYPSVKSVKDYVDSQVASATIADASASIKGKIKLAGDLGGNADAPTVPALALKAPINNPTFTGTVAGISKTMVGLGNVDNTTDASKPVSTATQTALNLKEDASNKSDNTSLGSSTTLYPTQNAVKTYVDGQIASATIADASTSVKGKIKLAGDLGGTADLPTVPDLALKAPINNPTFTGIVAGITKTMVGLGNVDNTSDANKPISSATQTALDLKLAKSDTASLSNRIDKRELLNNKSVSVSTDGTSDTKYPSVKAVKSYVDSQITSAGISVGSVSGSSTANAASITSGVLSLAPADGTNPGILTTGTQTIAGIKTFSNTTQSTSTSTGSVKISGGVGIAKSVNVGEDSYINGLKVGKGLASLSNNIAFGTSTLEAVTTGDQNIAIGSNALTANTNGSKNIAIGDNTLAVNTVGTGNTAIGSGSIASMNDASSGNVLRNTAVGYATLAAMTTGSYNTVLGTYALGNLTSGGSNVVLGNEAGWKYGTSAGTDNTGLNTSVLVGADARTLGNNESNEIVIGFQSRGLGSNTAVIGNSSTSLTSLNGKVLMGSTSDAGAYKLQVTGDTKLAGTLTITGGTPGTGKVLTSDANGLASWATAAAGGVTSVSAVSGTSTSNGASISGNSLSLAPADGTNPGIVTTSAQTFAGDKTFSGAVSSAAAISSSEVTASFTITAANASQYNGNVIICNPTSAINITIDNSTTIPTGFNFMVVQKSASSNRINFLAGTSATIVNRGGNTATGGQYAIATMVHIGNGVFVTSGDMQ